VTTENVIRLPHLWTPRPDQMPLWQYMQSGGKRAVEIAHRRWGKDDVALRWASVAAHMRTGNYWHMLPQYSQGRKAIWEAINPKSGKYRIDEAFPQDIRASTRNTDMVIQFKCGSQWQLVGSDNFNSVVGSPPVGVVFSEWALANPLAWAYIQPILEENGGWAMFITSSRGNNHAIQTLNFGKTEPGWFAEILRADQTGVFTAEQLERIEREMIAQFGPEAGKAMFNQEYMCSTEGAVYGAYYARQLKDARDENRITYVPHRPGIEVFTAWDLGVDDSMAIWFIQPVGRGFHCIDYYENVGRGLEHYAKVLNEKPYLYGGHFFPHDGVQREMTNGDMAKGRDEVAEDLGIKPITIVQRVKNIDTLIQVHIPTVRNLISLCHFDEVKCAKGLQALEGYHSEYDPEKKVLGNRPVHNWACHGSDAFRTFAVGYENIPAPTPKRSKVLELAAASTTRPEGSGSSWNGL